MLIADYLQRLQSYRPRHRRLPKSRQRLFLERLEDRTVPTLLWSNAGSRTVVDGGGPVLTHVDVDLVFWGSGWNSAQTLMNNVISSVTTIMNSSYLSALSQYRGIGSGQLLRTDLITSTSPTAHTRDSQFDTFVKTEINDGTLPVTPDMDSQILYMVIPQPGTTDPIDFAAGAHYTDTSNFGRFYYGWSEDISNSSSSLDDITDTVSHEIAESVTDPVPTTGFHVPSTQDEICDGDAQNYNYRIDGVLVQSILSQKDHAYVVYDGNSQKLVISATGALTVSGDQLSDLNDTVIVDQVNNGYQVTLNGEVFQFDARDLYTRQPTVSSMTIRPGTGNDTVDIEQTVRGMPVTVSLGSGTDTVNLAPTAQNLSNLSGAVTINGGSGTDTLNFFDEGTTTNQTYTVTSNTIARPGMATVTYQKLASIALNTSNGTDTISVQSSPAGTAVVVNGGNGSNTLVGSASNNTWNITGSNTGTLASSRIAGPVSFTSVQNLSAGVATDTFVFSDGAGISGNLDGGGGGSLDYSAYTSSVIVDLQTGTATGVGGSIAHIQNVTGGTGGGAGVYNILVGNGGNILTGGNGRRNLLIAGSSASTLTGGDDDDILIGGTTAYDMDVASLIAIMEYWSGTSDGYATRVSNLLAGNGVPQLDPSTVTSNGGGNTLTGGPGLNLYYGNNSDATDFDPSSGAVFVNV